MAAGPGVWGAARVGARDVLTRDDRELVPLADARLQLPFAVADYVDFYSYEHHAENVGRLFRPGRRRRCRRTGGTCRSATTAGPAPSS